MSMQACRSEDAHPPQSTAASALAAAVVGFARPGLYKTAGPLGLRYLTFLPRCEQYDRKVRPTRGLSHTLLLDPMPCEHFGADELLRNPTPGLEVGDDLPTKLDR
jgi:hypothetical protein